VHCHRLPARRHQVRRPHVARALELCLEARVHRDHEPLDVRGGDRAAEVDGRQHGVDGTAQLVQQACGADVDEKVGAEELLGLGFGGWEREEGEKK
jgi:hypothetical protein